MMIKSLILFFIVAILSPAHCLPPSRETEKKLNDSARRAIEILTPLITPLQKYHSEKGIYPKNINELVPKYIDKLPVEIEISNLQEKGFVPDLQFIYERKYELQETSDPRIDYNLSSFITNGFHQALSNYYKDNHIYPETLDELYPKYISANSEDLLKEFEFISEKEIRITYKTIQEFGFEAPNTPPGDDGCRYDFEINDWKCFGWISFK